MRGGGRCHGCTTTCNGGGARAGGHCWGAVRMQIMAAWCMVDILFVSSRKDEQDMTKACLTSHGLGAGWREHVPRKHTPITDPVTLLEYWQSPHPQRFIIPARTVRRLCTLGHRLGLLRRTASGVLILQPSLQLLSHTLSRIPLQSSTIYVFPQRRRLG